MENCPVAVDKNDFKTLFKEYKLLYLSFELKRIVIFFQSFEHAHKAISFLLDPTNLTDNTLSFYISPIQSKDNIFKTKNVRQIKQNYYNKMKSLAANFNGVITESAKKYVCKFIFTSCPVKDFNFSRHLIGEKGKNMINIVSYLDPHKDYDLKLRLRGQGSGFKEGSLQEESLDPLQLCVSGIDWDIFLLTVREAEKLVQVVDKDYRRFCQAQRVGYKPIAYKKEMCN